MTDAAPCHRNSVACPHHFHHEDPRYLQPDGESQTNAADPEKAEAGSTHDPNRLDQGLSTTTDSQNTLQTTEQSPSGGRPVVGFRRVVHNFTPSWFIVTMSTGVVSTLLYKIPYHARWLDILSYICLAFNIALFLLFTFISVLRYTIWPGPKLISVVMHHPHQSLFVATYPISLATITNMIVLVCVPAWGHGMAIFAWVLWWIVSAMALLVCLHMTWVCMTHRRGNMEEMTALYLIPIVCIVLAGTTGALVAGVLEEVNTNYSLWTLIISYIFWGIGNPLSWIILTLFFLRMSVHKPLEREVIVSLLVPIGPLGLSGFSLIALGKVARHCFPLLGLSNLEHAGEAFYLIGLLMGILLWGFALVWFVVALIMIATAFPFPFNMGWWGFVFPVGIFTLLTIQIGEEFGFRFFKVLSCVLTAACVSAWLFLAVRTTHRAATGKCFYAPCLGTDLYKKA